MPEDRKAQHPGVILVASFLSPRSISQYRLAVDIAVPPRRINEIVHGKRGITADTALRLARYFGNDPHYWMHLQADWELERARGRLGASLRSDVKVVGTPVAPPPARSRPPQGRPRTPLAEPAPDPADLADHLL